VGSLHFREFVLIFGRKPRLNGKLSSDDNNMLWQFSLRLKEFHFFLRPCDFGIRTCVPLLCNLRLLMEGETKNKKNINITEWSPYRVNELLSGDQVKHPVEDCKDLEDFVNSNLFQLFSFNELIWRIIQQRKIKITSFVEIWTWKEKVWDPLESCIGWMMQAITSWVGDTLRIEPEPTDFLAK